MENHRDNDFEEAGKGKNRAPGEWLALDRIAASSNVTGRQQTISAEAFGKNM